MYRIITGTVFMWISLKTKAESPFTKVNLTYPHGCDVALVYVCSKYIREAHYTML